MGFVDVPAAMKRADELLTEKDTLQEQLAAVRTALRTAVVDGDTTDEQTKWINETFKPQENKTPKERREAAEQRLKETQEKEEEAAAKGSSTRTRRRAAA